MGSIAAVSPHGRGAWSFCICLVSSLASPEAIRSETGKADGSCRSARILVHAIDHGARESMHPQSPFPARTTEASDQEYATENLSETQKAMLEDLRDYGLIWQRKVLINHTHSLPGRASDRA